MHPQPLHLFARTLEPVVPEAVRLFLPAACATIALLSAAPAVGSAQITSEYRISQRAAVVQHLANTTIQVDYSRPIARGRSPLFGNVIHWGEVWTPGANEATVLELSDTVELEGHSVPAGRWSVWLVPSNVGPWEILLDPRDSLFHTQRPEIGAESQIRVPVEPQPVEHVELLTWSFPHVTRTAATLQFAWGTTAVPLEIRVDAETPLITVPPDQAELYVGDWEITFEQSPGMPAGPLPPPQIMTVRHDDDGHLAMRWPPGVFGPPPDSTAAAPAAPDTLSAQERERAEARRQLADMDVDMYSIVLVPRTRGLFLLGFIENASGLLLDIERVFHEFEFEDGRAVRLTIRAEDDVLLARGTRKQ